MGKQIKRAEDCKTDQQKRIFLIQRFLGDVNRINWALEIKMAKKLLRLYDWQFLIWSGPPFKVRKLLEVLTTDGLSILNMKKTIWEARQKMLEEVPQIIGTEKFGGDFEMSNPIKNIAHFLKK